jgi:hypothetical protein
MTYERASELVASSRTKTRKVGNNTYLEAVAGGVAVRLHRTHVVVIHPDNTYTLNSGGWRTSTTKNRINQFSPAGLVQKRGEWLVRGSVPFADGMRI